MCIMVICFLTRLLVDFPLLTSILQLQWALMTLLDRSRRLCVGAAALSQPALDCVCGRFPGDLFVIFHPVGMSCITGFFFFFAEKKTRHSTSIS